MTEDIGILATPGLAGRAARCQNLFHNSSCEKVPEKTR
jgi:hypothetical protein